MTVHIPFLLEGLTYPSNIFHLFGIFLIFKFNEKAVYKPLSIVRNKIRIEGSKVLLLS